MKSKEKWDTRKYICKNTREKDKIPKQHYIREHSAEITVLTKSQVI